MNDVIADKDKSSVDNFAQSMTPDLIGFVFAIPALFGLGDHWYLSPVEEKESSDATWVMINALPKAKRKNVEKWMNEYFPFLMFAMVMGTIIGKRVMQTFEEMKAKKPAKLYTINKGETSNVESPGIVREGESETPIGNGTKRFISDPISEAFSASP